MHTTNTTLVLHIVAFYVKITFDNLHDFFHNYMYLKRSYSLMNLVRLHTLYTQQNQCKKFHETAAAATTK